jgi:hypothetical protein
VQTGILNPKAPGHLTSLGQDLEMDAPSFGFLRESNDILQDAEALRARMRQDGYLLLRGLLNRDEVLEARRNLCRQMAEAGMLDLSHDLMEAVSKPGGDSSFNPDMAAKSKELKKVVYEGPLMDFFARFLGGPVRHYDFTWLRTVTPGHGTPPHYDVVYMGRGTKNLYTTWTPLGDVDFNQGGLMILENSHLNERLKKTYGTKDVDTYCSNSKDADLYAAGSKWWNGWLSANPVSLRKMKDLGGRWLSSEFRAGDVLIFSMFTIHASLDNHSNRIRLSSDTRYQLASEPVDERWVGENPAAHGRAGKRGRIC